MSEQELIELLIDHLIEESYADNEESALVLIEHMSVGALENILEATATSGSVSSLNRAFNSKSASKGPSVRSRQHQGVSDKSGKGRSSGPSSSSRTDAGGKSKNRFARRGKIAGQRTPKPAPTPKATTPPKPTVTPKPGLKPTTKPSSGIKGGAGASVASAIGMEIAGKMAQTIGKPGQSRMSGLGIQGPPPDRTKPKSRAASLPKDYKSTEQAATQKAKEYQSSKQKPSTTTQQTTDTSQSSEPKTEPSTTTTTTTTTPTITTTKGSGGKKTGGSGGSKGKKPPKKPTKTPKIPNLRLPNLPKFSNPGTKTMALGGNIDSASDPNESFEAICDFLINEGYAETGTQAENLYNHMTDELRSYFYEQV